MSSHHRKLTCAEPLGRLHEGALAQADGLSAGDPGVPRPPSEGDSEDGVCQVWLEHRGDGDGQEERGERQKDVGDAHDDLVEPPTDVAGKCPQGRADEQRNQHNTKGRKQRRATSVEHAGQNVTAELVRAEGVAQTWGRELLEDVGFARTLVGVGCEPGGSDGSEDDQQQEN